MKPEYFKTSVAKRMRDPITTQTLETTLLLTGVEVQREELCRWSEFERAQVEDWAMREHMRASDNPVRVPQVPKCLSAAIKRGRAIW